MTISGLVVTLSPSPLRDSLEALGRDPRLTLGELQGNRLPVVAETATPEEGEALVEGLLTTPGVLFVDVVRVDFVEGREDTHGTP